MKLELRVLPLMLLIAYSNGLQSPSPFEPSDSVPSGPAECFFIVNDDQVESLMVTEEEVDLPVIAFGSCELNILAVGGGGRGLYQGGGSGYLQYQKKKIDPFSGITSLNAKAGSYAEASTVTYNGSIVLVQANPGQEADGYSGGGQYEFPICHGGSDGGSDGSDGEGSRGGSGTGEDISEYVFTAWTLTPGAGGIHYEDGCYGGGGGGVMVDGAGPDTDQYTGQGFGGGGSGRGTNGLEGLVLLEISPTQN